MSSSIEEIDYEVVEMRIDDRGTPDYELNCKRCAAALGFDFSYAFQPIIHSEEQSIFGYEALVRGVNGESAYEVLKQVTDDKRYAFDQIGRQKAIRIASELQLESMLSINFLPNAVYEPEHCIQSTLNAAAAVNFPIENIRG